MKGPNCAKGYDANIDNWLSSAGSNTLHQHAANLLWDIYDARETLTARSLPIIFVVHGKSFEQVEV